jgi:TonB family protein
MNTPVTMSLLLPFFVACVVKATIVWIFAVIVAACLRRAAAASRHLVWAAAVLASLALPLLTTLLPVWRSASLTRAAALWNPAQPSATELTQGNASPMIVNAAASAFHAAPWLLAIWGIGLVAVASRLFGGLFRTATLSGRARVMVNSAWTVDLEEIAQSLRIDRDVRLLQSADSSAMPLTWGVRRPTILLPLGASDWPPERRRIVLSHELAHIARVDWLLQICAEISRAIYWFHPLAWKAGSALRYESERACDDVVLNSGIAGEDYAGELLTIARSLKNSPASICPALAIARTTNLERRFAAMLNSSVNRRSSRRSKLFVGLAALFLLLPLAAVRAPAQNAGSFSGTVYDASGAVVPNATVILSDAKNKSIEMSSSVADGTFSFKSLPPGDYALQAMKPGFEVARDQELVLKVGENRALNIHLKVGTISDSVDVQADGHAQAASATPAKRLKVGGEVEGSKIVTKVQPVYPESAKKAGVQGNVNLRAVIGMDGVPLSLQVVNTDIDPDLARASIEAVSKWRYSPTLLNGQPIEVDTNVTIRFTLNP